MVAQIIQQNRLANSHQSTKWSGTDLTHCLHGSIKLNTEKSEQSRSIGFDLAPWPSSIHFYPSTPSAAPNIQMNKITLSVQPLLSLSNTKPPSLWHERRINLHLVNRFRATSKCRSQQHINAWYANIPFMVKWNYDSRLFAHAQMGLQGIVPNLLAREWAWCDPEMQCILPHIQFQGMDII